ncbi:hypothetical protein WME99_39145 [Sorangium sp. So ce136]
MEALRAAEGRSIATGATQFRHNTWSVDAELAIVNVSITIVVSEVTNLVRRVDISNAIAPFAVLALLRSFDALTDPGNLRIPMAVLNLAVDTRTRIVRSAVAVFVKPVALVHARKHITHAIAPDTTLASLLPGLAAAHLECRLRAAIALLFLTWSTLMIFVHDSIAVVVSSVLNLFGGQEITNTFPPNAVRTILLSYVTKTCISRVWRTAIALLHRVHLACKALVHDAVAVIIDTIAYLVFHAGLQTTGAR